VHCARTSSVVNRSRYDNNNVQCIDTILRLRIPRISHEELTDDLTSSLTMYGKHVMYLFATLQLHGSSQPATRRMLSLSSPRYTQRDQQAHQVQHHHYCPSAERIYVFRNRSNADLGRPAACRSASRCAFSLHDMISVIDVSVRCQPRPTQKRRARGRISPAVF